jgi:DNA-binding MarR family transcriptional regulator
MTVQKKKPTASRASGRKSGARERIETGEQASRVLRRFRQIFYAIKTHFQQVEKTAGIGGAQLWALSIIQDRPGIGVNELALAMDIHQSTASNLVRALIERNLIAALRSEPDKRAVHLEALAAGRALLRKAPGPFTGVLPRALANLDRKTLARLDRDLSDLIELLGAEESAGGTPLAQLLAKPSPRRSTAR